MQHFRYSCNAQSCGQINRKVSKWGYQAFFTVLSLLIRQLDNQYFLIGDESTVTKPDTAILKLAYQKLDQRQTS